MRVLKVFWLLVWAALLPSSFSAEKDSPNFSVDQLQEAIQQAQNSLSVIYNRFQVSSEISRGAKRCK
jgi:hypothetical protein